MEEKLILYSTGCPKCNVLKKKLDAKGIDYEICTDTETMQSLGIENVPVLSVDNKLLNFSEANTLINEVEDK